MLNPRAVIGLSLALLCLSGAVLAAPPRRNTRAARKPAAKPPSAETGASTRPMTLSEAREAVTMLDDAYQLTLEQVHRWYPNRTGQPIVAATVVKKVQAIMGEKGWPQSHFLAVEGMVMNPDHLARDDFEKHAVKELRSGKERVEAIENGKLRAATLLPLTGGCQSCHWMPAGQQAKAAISFTIPLKPGEPGE